MQVHEARTARLHLEWPSPTRYHTIHSLRLALARGDETGLIEALYDVSTPSSTNYGSQISKREVQLFITPLLAYLNEEIRLRRS